MVKRIYPRINIHMPTDLLEEVKKLASEDSRSLSNMIVVLVRRGMKVKNDDK